MKLCGIASLLFSAAALYAQQPTPPDAKSPAVTPATAPASGVASSTQAQRSAETGNASIATGATVSASPQANQVGSAPATVTSSSVQPANQGITPPAPPQVPSLTAKELLDANSQAVTHLASMFQMFAALITIIVGVVGLLATWLGLFLKKSVAETVAEWSKKLETIKTEMDAAKAKLHEAVSQAQASASDASRQAQSITDAQTVLSKTLQELDTVKAKLAALTETGAGNFSARSTPEGGAAPTPSIASTVETVTPAESAEVADLLKGKLPPQPGGTPAV
jgi:hypothetical protein